MPIRRGLRSCAPSTRLRVPCCRRFPAQSCPAILNNRQRRAIASGVGLKGCLEIASEWVIVTEGPDDQCFAKLLRRNLHLFVGQQFKKHLITRRNRYSACYMAKDQGQVSDWKQFQGRIGDQLHPCVWHVDPINKLRWNRLAEGLTQLRSKT